MSSRLVFAILAHADEDCLADFVDSLRHYEPTGRLLLFNGGRDATFGGGIDIEVCRYSRPIRWGENLHEFHLGVMRQLHEDGVDYDKLVFLDSDMLMLAPGFSSWLDQTMAGGDYLGAYLRPIARHDKWPWGRYLRVQWQVWREAIPLRTPWACYNPGQVLSRRLVDRFAELPERDRICTAMRASGLPVLEELIFPSLAVALGESPQAYPKAQGRALWGAHLPSQVHAWATSGDVWLVHKIGMSLEAPDRLAARAARNVTEVDLVALDALAPSVGGDIAPDVVARQSTAKRLRAALGRLVAARKRSAVRRSLGGQTQTHPWGLPEISDSSLVGAG